jgi:hypothetical protein
MWVKAVEKAGTTDPDKVIDAIIGVSVPNLTGGYSTIMPNHHITKPVLIGEIQADGQFEIVQQTPGCRRRRMVRLPAGLQGPDLRLAQAHELRQLQCCHRQVRRQGLLSRTSGTAFRSARCCCWPRSASPSPSASWA